MTPDGHPLDLGRLFAFAFANKASDIHITVGEPPLLRVHGHLHRLESGPLDAEAVRELVHSLMTDRQRLELEQRLAIDFSFEFGQAGRFRVNVFHDRCGLAAVMRTVPTVTPTLEALGLPPIVRKLCNFDRGLVLVTGPTGSGKSTTLASMIEVINATTAGRIITVEDPIEFVHPSKRSLVSQRELGVHTLSFADALRGALREDPDVILVGEMRDLETIRLAITAAETGHLVFSTLHAPSAPQAVDRMIDVYPPEQQAQIRGQLADSLLAVITQALLPKVGGGRVAAAEVLIGTPAVHSLIREAKTHQLASIMQLSAKDGMQTMEMAVAQLVRSCLVDSDVAARARGGVG